MKENKIVAVIDIGSNRIKLNIAQIFSKKKDVILESLKRHINIGKDTFSQGRLELETMHEICFILKDFQKIIREYKVQNVKIVATSGFRDAKNKKYIVEQIKNISGMNVEILNTAQERYYTLKSLHNLLNKDEKLKQEGILIVNIGSGGVELVAYKENKLKLNEYLKIGSLRLKEILKELENETLLFPKILEEFVESKLIFLKKQIINLNIKHFIAQGSGIKNIIQIINLEKNKEIINLDKKSLINFYQKINSMTSNQLVKNFKISELDSQTLLPSIEIFKTLINWTLAENLIISKISLNSGIIMKIKDEQENFSDYFDTMNCVDYIANKYHFDEIHCKWVEKLAIKIFEETKKIHKLREKEKFYLKIASLLHDIGKSISVEDHEWHAYNILLGQQLLGLSDEELLIIANTIRYHGDLEPIYYHENFKELSAENQIIVAKLSAILKMANSLDSSYKQKIEIKKINFKAMKAQIEIVSKKNALLEYWSFQKNSNFFEKVMGINVTLNIISPN